MSWARIDDGFDAHPKTRRLSLAAAGLFARGLSHSARYLTDGFLDDAWLNVAGSSRERRRAVAELSREGMLTRVDGGWLIHDYLDFNPSRAQVLSERERARARKAAQRERLSSTETTTLSPCDSSRSPGWEGGSTATTTENGRDSRARARAPRLDRQVQQVLAVLRQAPRFSVGATTHIGVQAALCAHPGKDAIAAANEAVVWVSDPAFRDTHAPRVFAAALRNQPVRSDQRPNAAAYSSDATCPDCREPFDRSALGREHPNAGRCDDCQGRFEAIVLGDQEPVT